MYIRMQIKVILFSLLVLAFLFAPLPALCTPVDDWEAIIVEGSHHKFEGQYSLAIQSFQKAETLAESKKLPAKCLPITLCRLAESEVLFNKVTEADSHF